MSLLFNKMLDNKKTGIVGDALKPYFKKNAKVAIMSSYFTIYAFEALKKELMKVEEVRFLFIDPTFTSERDTKDAIDSDKRDREKNCLVLNSKLRCGMNLLRRKSLKNVRTG